MIDAVKTTFNCLIIFIAIIGISGFFGYGEFRASMERKYFEKALNGVGIQKINHNFTEINGVKSNWYEIVWFDKKI